MSSVYNDVAGHGGTCDGIYLFELSVHEGALLACARVAIGSVGELITSYTDVIIIRRKSRDV